MPVEGRGLLALLKDRFVLPQGRGGCLVVATRRFRMEPPCVGCYGGELELAGINLRICDGGAGAEHFAFDVQTLESFQGVVSRYLGGFVFGFLSEEPACLLTRDVAIERLGVPFDAGGQIGMHA